MSSTQTGLKCTGMFGAQIDLRHRQSNGNIWIRLLHPAKYRAQNLVRLWLDMLPINLLFFAPGNGCVRPVRSVPPWSRVFVDGEISHRLMSTRWKLDKGQAFRCPWVKVDPLISDTYLIEESVSGLIHDATLQLRGHLCKLDKNKIDVFFDISGLCALEELHCLPVLPPKDVHFSARIK